MIKTRQVILIKISIDAIKRSGPGSKGRLTLQMKKVESYTVGASVSALIILGGPRFQQLKKKEKDKIQQRRV